FAANELDCLLDPPVALVISVCGQHLENPASDIDCRWIEHRVVVSKWNLLEDHAVVVLVERRPAAILALHGKDPVNGALHRLPLIAAVGMLHPAQGKANHRTVVDV